ncbi:MAG: J domain-containing protein, partial [Polyangiales bacterium]
MTFEEALKVLAVDREADAETVRRAYARAVRLHKPERDPEGFQRVRAAYELVCSAAENGPPMAPRPDLSNPR